jgi:hypothetical protein
MANALFTSARNAFLGLTTTVAAQIDLDTDTIKIALFDATDTPVPAPTTMWKVSDCGAGWAPADPFTNGPTLGTKTIGVIAAGVFDADNTTFTALPAADGMDYMVLFKALTSTALSPMIAFWDTFTSGMPVTPNGGDVTVQWHASGIFAI